MCPILNWGNDKKLVESENKFSPTIVTTVIAFEMEFDYTDAARNMQFNCRWIR
jgi:hypothetical protein